VYGPVAAFLVEFFPAKIRYTSLSIPYHIGNGDSAAGCRSSAGIIVAATGNVFRRLDLPIAIGAHDLRHRHVFVAETKHVQDWTKSAASSHEDGDDRVIVVIMALVAGGSAARGQNAEKTAEKKIAFGFTTLNLLRDKGIITPAEYESALRDLGETVGAKASESLSLMLSKWSATLYGFAETDLIYDTTQTSTKVRANAQIARPDSYGGTRGGSRSAFATRGSAIRIRAPSGITSAPAPTSRWTFSERKRPRRARRRRSPRRSCARATTTSRSRRRCSTSCSVSRGACSAGSRSSSRTPSRSWGCRRSSSSGTPQLRVSKTIKTAPINLEIALALVRSPQLTPACRGPGRRAAHRQQMDRRADDQLDGTQISPLSLGVSGRCGTSA